MSTNFKNMILIYGSEKYLINKKKDEIVNTLTPKNNRGDFHEYSEHGTNNIRNVLSSIRCKPMFSENKVVVVTNTCLITKNRFARASHKKRNIVVLENLIIALKNLSGSNGYAIFIATPTIHKKKILTKFLFENAQIFQCDLLKDSEVTLDWIKNHCIELGSSIEDEAAILLYEICDNNLSYIDTELQKIITYMGSFDEITKEDILKVSKPEYGKSYMLLDYLTFGDIANALSLLKQLEKYNMHQDGVLDQIICHFRALLKIKSLYEEEKASISVISYNIKKSKAIVEKWLACLETISMESLIRIYSLLAEYDIKLVEIKEFKEHDDSMTKDTKTKGYTLLELLCVDITTIINENRT